MDLTSGVCSARRIHLEAHEGLGRRNVQCDRNLFARGTRDFAPAENFWKAGCKRNIVTPCRESAMGRIVLKNSDSG